MDKRASRWGAFFIAALFCAAPAQAGDPACRADRIDEQAEVTDVIDGDTLRLANGRLVRLIGINTPEINHEGAPSEPHAEAARDAAAALLARDRRVGLRYDAEREDRYRRLLAHVFLADGRSLEVQQLAQGLAAQVVVPPNLWQADCLRTAEQAARAANQGVWATLYRPLPVAQLSRESQGFRILRGRIERVGESRHSIWLNFPRRPGEGEREGVALRVDRDDLHYFSDWRPQELHGREIEVRGWLSKYKNQLVMALRHPAAVSIVQ